MIIRIEYKILKKNLNKLWVFYRIFRWWCAEFDSDVRDKLK